ncbi:hypothetical protein GJ744_008551 [Endocarpon pusillum]|uniref:Uncharacterized protein n=1 Tax=Endocarpon pusillum TaxID=364733 RepID=A0A8H7AH16_9EURO|nr:hypothetical protein GJ744_008551 [Endocarpon pusillum]
MRARTSYLSERDSRNLANNQRPDEDWRAIRRVKGRTMQTTFQVLKGHEGGEERQNLVVHVEILERRFWEKGDGR